jgi:hypothetical protein
LSKTVLLTGEFLPFQALDRRARVQCFVENVLVDRGMVQEGEWLVILSAGLEKTVGIYDLSQFTPRV